MSNQTQVNVVSSSHSEFPPDEFAGPRFSRDPRLARTMSSQDSVFDVAHSMEVAGERPQDLDSDSDETEDADVLRPGQQEQEASDRAALAAAAGHRALSPLCFHLEAIGLRLNDQLDRLGLPQGVTAIYNPTVYGEQVYRDYLRRMLPPRVAMLFVDMCPSPFGQCQTAVPLGWGNAVRDWMPVRGEIGQPEQQVPQVPVRGLRSCREDAAGERFWTTIRHVFRSTLLAEDWLDRFLASGCFVYTWCPVAFFRANGRDLKPDGLEASDRLRLEKRCNNALIEFLDLIEPGVRVICIGDYVESVVLSAMQLAKEQRFDVDGVLLPARNNTEPNQLLKMLDPSKYTLGNRRWLHTQRRWLLANGIGPN